MLKVLLFALALAIAPLAAPAALSQDTESGEVQAGIGPACDTAEQMERLLTLFAGGDLNPALTAVNAEFGADACAVLGIYYQRGAEVKRIQVPTGRYAIIAISVIGVRTPAGPRPLAQPMPLFIAAKLEEHGA